MIRLIAWNNRRIMRTVIIQTQLLIKANKNSSCESNANQDQQLDDNEVYERLTTRKIHLLVQKHKVP